MPDNSFARSWRTVARLAPERVALVCGESRRTYGELDDRARRLARVLHDHGVGPGSKVAIECVNSIEYMETFYAAQLLGAVPVNVNYRYTGSELAFLLDNADADALVFHDDFGAAVADALLELPPNRHPGALLSVEHGNATTLAALDYESAIAGSEPGFEPSHEMSGDDLIFLYTGGTTGAPKAVMWRSDDLYRSIWKMSRPDTEPPDAADVIARGKVSATSLPACPLMHGTGLFTALNTLAGGGKVVLLDRTHLDPEGIWDAVESEQVVLLTIVGDAFGRPLLAALDDHPHHWNLTSLAAIMSSGVTWSPECKRGLLAHLDGALLIDSLGASEGLITRTESRAGDELAPARFKLSEKMVVVADDGELVEAGDGRVGLLGVGGPVPLGYYKDPIKSAETFRTVNGERYSIPGDYATVETDGTITLLGRGSACINTGGEKVYPEEVELVLRAHPALFDAAVVGVPDEKWGEMVVAIVQPTRDDAPGEHTLHDWCRERLAGYKTPKLFVLRDSLERSPAGKVDYKLLREIAAVAVKERT